MDAADPLKSAALPPARQNLAWQARLLRGLSLGSQIVLMIALFVMWKQFRMPFSQAFEKCFLCGVVIYVLLGTLASALMTLARLQPVQVLLRQLVGIISVLIFCALRYIYGMGILKAALTWLVIYIASRILVRRIESNALRQFQMHAKAGPRQN